MFTSGFFNSINGDRKYSSEQISQFFDGLITDGIFMTIGNQMMITADENMTVILETGRAWFNHTWSLNDTRMPLDLQQSSDIYDRIDAIVLEVNSDPQTRDNSIKILKGENAESNPVRPTLEKSYYIHQYPLAYISIPKRSKEITQAQITNMVGTSETPFVTGIIQGINIDRLVAQWQDQWAQMVDANQEEFDAWFAEIQGQLSGDIAGQLQEQLNEQANAIMQAQQNIATLQASLDAYKSLTDQDIDAVLTVAQNAGGLASSAYDLAQVANNGLSGKQNTITGGVSTGVTNDYTAGRVMRSNSNGKLDVSSITETQLGYLSGVTSNIQTQLNNKLPLNPSSIEIYSSGAAYIDFHPNGTTTDYRFRIIDDGARVSFQTSAGSSTSFNINGNAICTLVGTGRSGIWDWIKFSSGIAICVSTSPQTSGSNYPTGNHGGIVYWGAKYGPYALPFAFQNMPAVYANIAVYDRDVDYAYDRWITMGVNKSNGAPFFYLYGQDGNTQGHPAISIALIGRWK